MSRTITPDRKPVHLVCNAHLDPVWQWTWEDGLTEAISTFRVAADFCERYDEFVFNHNEALLYGWVLKHDPILFKRIQRLVKQNRWHIAGGAFLQPDVNGPSGESHIRQFLMGLKFFKQHFDRRPTTAYNFDPFGHPEGFAQILSGCGMDSYIFCRPDYGTYDLPVGSFQWSDRSNASVVARRSDDHYVTRAHTVYDVDSKLPQFLEHYADEPATMILWGIGNHGGGPSRREFRQIRDYIRKHPESHFIHSTPEAFFQQVRKKQPQLPEVRGEMQESFPGCYTSMSRVKRAHRTAEHLILEIERLAALAWWFDGAPYPAESLDTCWRDILFCEFHDILPGSSVPRVEQDALALLGGVYDRLRRLRFDTLANIVRGQASARDGQVPVFVTNPHGFTLECPVQIEYNVASLGGNDKAIQLHHRGRPVPFQRLSADHNLGGQEFVRLVVPLKLKPFEIRRLDASLVPGKPMLPRPAKPTRSTLRLKSDRGTVQINPRTGLIDSIIPTGHRRSLVRPGAMRPVLFEDLDHSWTCGDPNRVDDPAVGAQAPPWKAPKEKFRLATISETAALSPLSVDKWKPGKHSAAEPVRVIECGDLRTSIEALFVAGQSFINRQYVFCHKTGRLEIRDRVMFLHKDKMLKLAVPLAFTPDHSRCESLYSVVRREPTRDYHDHHNQRWVAALASEGQYLAVINDGSFAHCLTHNTLAINVMRSPAYTSFNIQPDDPYNDRRFAPRQDQGEHQMRYVLDWGQRLDEHRMLKLADSLNAEPFAYVYYPDSAYGRSKLCSIQSSALAVSSRNVRIVAVKKAESGNALVVRLQEVRGRSTRCDLRLARQTVKVELAAYGLTTLLLTRRGGRLLAKPCNLVEGL